ncbi:MAG: MOSC N-terminal beta barrel domain-containing protein [Geodermatophilaceae bacterium]|nr:MOSC N-terminal beta barrel domain-containing protein [Geodermatophilaceae bacterium]
MRVLEIWRYPVKSLQGEQLDTAEVGSQGLTGDRRFAIFDAETGFGLTARRQPRLLFAAASMRPDGSVLITLPDGSVAADDAALSAWLDRPVVLRSTEEVRERRFENPVDFEEEAGAWEPFSGSSGAFHDSGRASVSLLSTATITGWEPRRFRSNLLLEGAGEDELVGSRVRVGGAELAVGMRIERCVMTTRPQPGGIDRDLDVLRTIHRERGGNLAVGADVVQSGSVQVGDELQPG